MARPIGIRIHRGSDLLDTQVLERDIIKIGRLAPADLRLDDPKVSRIHAVIEVADKEAAIIDMGSAEGTRVNGEKVSRVRLNHGDEIGLGDSRLVVVLDEVELAAIKGDGVAGVAPLPSSGSTPGARLREPDSLPVPTHHSSAKSAPRQKPAGQENWTWDEIHEGRRLSKAEKRNRRLLENLGATPTGNGDYSHTPESAAIAVLILVMSFAAIIFFPKGC